MHSHNNNNNNNTRRIIDDERQFKTAKGNYINKCILAPQAPGDATVLKRFFRDNFVIFRRR